MLTQKYSEVEVAFQDNNVRQWVTPALGAITSSIDVLKF